MTSAESYDDESEFESDVEVVSAAILEAIDRYDSDWRAAKTALMDQFSAHDSVAVIANSIMGRIDLMHDETSGEDDVVVLAVDRDAVEELLKRVKAEEADERRKKMHKRLAQSGKPVVRVVGQIGDEMVSRRLDFGLFVDAAGAAGLKNARDLFIEHFATVKQHTLLAARAGYRAGDAHRPDRPVSAIELLGNHMILGYSGFGDVDEETVVDWSVYDETWTLWVEVTQADVQQHNTQVMAFADTQGCVFARCGSSVVFGLNAHDPYILIFRLVHALRTNTHPASNLGTIVPARRRDRLGRKEAIWRVSEVPGIERAHVKSAIRGAGSKIGLKWTNGQIDLWLLKEPAEKV